MFRPRNHNLSDITDTVLASRATKEILAVQELGNGNGGLGTWEMATWEMGTVNCELGTVEGEMACRTTKHPSYRSTWRRCEKKLGTCAAYNY